MADFNELDRRILDVLDGRERLKLLLKDRGLSVQDFAQKHNVWVEQVSMCLKGDRPYGEIRDALALELEISRETVDGMIDSTDQPAAENIA